LYEPEVLRRFRGKITEGLRSLAFDVALDKVTLDNQYRNAGSVVVRYQDPVVTNRRYRVTVLTYSSATSKPKTKTKTKH
jgi:hypothetical protein